VSSSQISVPNAERLPQAVEKEKTERDFADRGWWWYTPEEAAEDAARIARGEEVGIPLEEILRELQDRIPK
jgi:hypothetical protein